MHPRVNFPWARYDIIDPKGQKSLELIESSGKISRHRYLLCTHRLAGFVLRSRTWGALLLSFPSDRLLFAS